MISRNYCRFDIRLFKECREHTDKYRIEKIFRLLEKSIIADGLYPESIEEHDKYFEPKNKEEQQFWDSCRNLAKEDMDNLLKYSEAGKKGAETRKQKKQEPVSQPTPAQKPIKDTFVPPKDANEVYEYACVNGMICSKEQAENFFDYYSGIGWRLGNEYRTPMHDWHPFVRKWLSNPIITKAKAGNLPRVSLKEIKEMQNDIEIQKILNGER